MTKHIIEQRRQIASNIYGLLQEDESKDRTPLTDGVYSGVQKGEVVSFKKGEVEFQFKSPATEKFDGPVVILVQGKNINVQKEEVVKSNSPDFYGANCHVKQLSQNLHLQKSFGSDLTHQMFLHDLEKGGKRAVVGETRTYNGEKWVKHTDGWVHVSERTGKTRLHQNDGKVVEGGADHTSHYKTHIDRHEREIGSRQNGASGQDTNLTPENNEKNPNDNSSENAKIASDNVDRELAKEGELSLDLYRRADELNLIEGDMSDAKLSKKMGISLSVAKQLNQLLDEAQHVTPPTRPYDYIKGRIDSIISESKKKDSSITTTDSFQQVFDNPLFQKQFSGKYSIYGDEWRNIAQVFGVELGEIKDKYSPAIPEELKPKFQEFIKNHLSRQTFSNLNNAKLLPNVQGLGSYARTIVKDNNIVPDSATDVVFRDSTSALDRTRFVIEYKLDGLQYTVKIQDGNSLSDKYTKKEISLHLGDYRVYDGDELTTGYYMSRNSSANDRFYDGDGNEITESEYDEKVKLAAKYSDNFPTYYMNKLLGKD